MSTKFELKGRDIVVAQFTEATGLAEIFRALSKQDGPALIRISNFGSRVAFEALAIYAGAMIDQLNATPKPDITIGVPPEPGQESQG